jgi:serine protease
METHPPSLLELLTEADLATTKIIAGVPVYNYHFANPEGGMNPSAMELAQAKTWVINFPDSYTDGDIHEFCKDPPGNSKCDYEGHPDENGLDFAEFTGTESELELILQGHPSLNPQFIEPDMPVSAIPDEDYEEGGGSFLEDGANTPWGLDRIDDLAGTDGSYVLPTGSKQGQGAHVYVADTGVHVRHQDFEGRAQPSIESLGCGAPKECSATDYNCAADRHGHGTHCAGTVGGKIYGVAKRTALYGVKVLSDRGSGSFCGIMKSVDWVAQKGKKPAVWSASLGGPGRSMSAETAFAKALKAGVTISVAAGNSRSDACNFNPAFAPSAITVGATQMSGSADKRAGFSNFGKCVDIFAPGVGIRSASHRNNDGHATMSGTSMACPHVSGAAAVLLADNPGLDPKGLWTMMQYNAHGGKVQDPRGTPNLMLYTGGLVKPTLGPTTTPAPTTTTLPPTMPPMGSY